VKSKQRLAILFGAVVALLTLLAVVPVFGATGTLRFPDSSDTTTVVSWARQGSYDNQSQVMIEVADSDLDTGAAQSITVTLDGTCAAGQSFQLNTVAAVTGGITGTVHATTTVVAPILDNDSSGTVNASDVTLTDAGSGLAVSSVDGQNGIITMLCTSANTDNRTVTLAYNSGSVNKTYSFGDTRGGATNTTSTVEVTSDASPQAHVVVLEESGSESGIFRGVLNLTTTATDTTTYRCLNSAGCTVAAGDSNQSAGEKALGWALTSTAGMVSGEIASGQWSVGDLQVSTADTVVFVYDDTTTTNTASARSATITVETTDPTVESITPATGTATDNNLPSVTAQVTDSDSLIDSTTLKVVFGFDFTDTPDATIDDSDMIDVADADIDTVTSGFAIEQRVNTINATEQNEDHVIYWWVIGNDKAGNKFVSDALPTNTDGTADACDPDAWFAAGFNADDGLNTKAHGTSSVVKGCQGYTMSVDRTAPDAASAATGVWWDSTKTGDDKTETTVTKADPEYISVVFDGALDQSSVDLTDFTVDGNTPLAIETYAGATTRVFLKVASQDPASRPEIKLVGQVLDKAGNSADSDTVTSADGIAPTLTVSVSTTASTAARPVTNDLATAALSSDEKATNVQIFVVKVGANTSIAYAGVSETELTETGGPTSWTATADMSGDGLYNVRATARDLNSTTNIGSAGTTSTVVTTDAIDLTKAVLFELDTSIPTPTILPSTAAGTDDVNAVISINFVNEGVEYGLTSAGAASNTPADVTAGTDFDSFGTVTVTAAELDDVDILADLSTADNIRFLYKASNLTIGDHKVEVSATDTAGNKVDFTAHTFTVSQRASTTISLSPGWNMISLPGDPGDSAIDAVIGTVPVTTVMAYDPTDAAQWLIATRDSASDSFSGTLTTMTSRHGYWVYTDTFESISTFIPRVSGGAADGGTPVTPTTISLVKGWNLVPVVDMTGDLTSASLINADDYFGSVAKITRVYWFDTLNGKWVTLDHTDTSAGGTDAETVYIGRAYWVYTSEAGVLTP